MKITLARHGGLAAGIRRPAVAVDSSTLPQPLAAELARLVGAALASPVVERDVPGRARDAMSYTITIDDGGTSTVLRSSDATMTPSFATLLDWLEGHPAA